MIELGGIVLALSIFRFAYWRVKSQTFGLGRSCLLDLTDQIVSCSVCELSHTGDV